MSLDTIWRYIPLAHYSSYIFYRLDANAVLQKLAHAVHSQHVTINLVLGVSRDKNHLDIAENLLACVKMCVRVCMSREPLLWYQPMLSHMARTQATGCAL